jgi:hypothetical protein
MQEIFLSQCAIISARCGMAGAPDAPNIQSAYWRESSNGSELHDKGLQVIAAACNAHVEGTYLCEISFVSNGDPDQRLYFDVVAVARTGGEWELKSGLCKR